MARYSVSESKEKLAVGVLTTVMCHMFFRWGCLILLGNIKELYTLLS